MLEFVQRNHQCLPDQGLHLYQNFVDEPDFLSYRELPDRVAGYADFFQDHQVRPGTRVLFPFETSHDALCSFLALIQIGALPLSVKPYLMNSHRESYEGFLSRVAARFDATRILSLPSLDGVELPVPSLLPPPPTLKGSGARLRIPADNELAFVQFSSGSTSFPKGIPIRHDKLRANLAMITRTGQHRPQERVSSWLPLYHDMGLVGAMFACVAAGGDMLLAKPETFLLDPVGWWQHMARERVAVTVIPNFAIDYSLKFMRDLTSDDIAALDLSSLRSIYLGSEPINIAHLVAFMDMMTATGLRRDVFMPCYGMAEAVLLVASRPPQSTVRITNSPSGVPAISVGRPMPEFSMRLRNEDGAPCADNELGEIELAGGSLAPSYFDDDSPLGAQDGFYATGDIGFINDGELFVTGRISDRIKVNGQSLFAADFEQAVERLPFVRTGRTAVVQTNGRITVVAEVRRSARTDIVHSRAQIVEHLANTIGVTVHASDVHFVRSGQIPRTSSGKLQRRAIAAACERGQLQAWG